METHVGACVCMLRTLKLVLHWGRGTPCTKTSAPPLFPLRLCTMRTRSTPRTPELAVRLKPLFLIKPHISFPTAAVFVRSHTHTDTQSASQAGARCPDTQDVRCTASEAGKSLTQKHKSRWSDTRAPMQKGVQAPRHLGNWAPTTKSPGAASPRTNYRTCPLHHSQTHVGALLVNPCIHPLNRSVFNFQNLLTGFLFLPKGSLF